MGNELLDGFQWILNSSQTSFNYLDSNSEIPEVPAPPSLAAALRSSLDPSSTTLSRSLICKLTNKLQLLTTDPTLYNLHINWNCKGFFAVTLPSLVHWLPLVGRCRDPVLANRIPTQEYDWSDESFVYAMSYLKHFIHSWIVRCFLKFCPLKFQIIGHMA